MKTATVHSQVVIRQDHNCDDSDDSRHETVDAEEQDKFRAWYKERQNRKRKHAISSSSNPSDSKIDNEVDILQVQAEEESHSNDRPNANEDSDYDVDTELAKRLNKNKTPDKSNSIREKVEAEYNQEEEYGPPIGKAYKKNDETNA